ncbi:hypothetical protein 16Q_141 [Pseudomonas phage 16Q]|nr:hypothetical protein 16Q_141 [Pseudomonas phage 16Q]
MKGPTPTKDKTIPIGSTVRVTDQLQQYRTYNHMAGYMGLSNWSGSGGVVSDSVEEGRDYKVFAKARHEDDFYGELLGLVDDNGDSYIISITGVELVTEYKKPLSDQVADLELQLQAALDEVESLKALVENIKNLVK